MLIRRSLSARVSKVEWARDHSWTDGALKLKAYSHSDSPSEGFYLRVRLIYDRPCLLQNIEEVESATKLCLRVTTVWARSLKGTIKKSPSDAKMLEHCVDAGLPRLTSVHALVPLPPSLHVPFQLPK